MCRAAISTASLEPTQMHSFMHERASDGRHEHFPTFLQTSFCLIGPLCLPRRTWPLYVCLHVYRSRTLPGTGKCVGPEHKMCTSLKILSGTLAQGSNGFAHTSISRTYLPCSREVESGAVSSGRSCLIRPLSLFLSLSQYFPALIPRPVHNFLQQTCSY